MITGLHWALWAREQRGEAAADHGLGYSSVAHHYSGGDRYGRTTSTDPAALPVTDQDLHLAELIGYAYAALRPDTRAAVLRIYYLTDTPATTASHQLGLASKAQFYRLLESGRGWCEGWITRQLTQ